MHNGEMLSPQLIVFLVCAGAFVMAMYILKELVAGPPRGRRRRNELDFLIHDPSPSKADYGPPPYVLRSEGLLTIAERGFFGALEMAAAKAGQETGVPLRVFAKVRLADLLKTPVGTERWQMWQNMIQQKHVDFVVCAGEELRPIAAVELDDSSHDRAGRGDRDEFVDAAFEAAGLPLRRERVAGRGRGYSVEDLARGLMEVVKGE